ncbi:GIY-YIG nuclease family protein [Shewanella sp. A25]|nr:GIY-YIG nuclease family protein [Shewanella shenzhenensis]
MTKRVKKPVTSAAVEVASASPLVNPEAGVDQALTPVSSGQPLQLSEQSQAQPLPSTTQSQSKEQLQSKRQSQPLDAGGIAAKKAESLWYLYLIRCANGHLYAGITTDVARRFNEHQSGGAKAAKFLRGKGPLTLMYQELVGSYGDALRREIAVKKLSRAKKLALIEAGYQSVT